MSWSAVAGAAPYQAPPYANAQPGYGQHPPYPYAQQPPYGQVQSGPPYPGPPQRPHDNRPPKKKGNPIITRYPPPPGYRGPAQPQGPFNAQQYPGQYQPTLQPGFPPAPPVQSGYPGQSYAAGIPPQGYPPQGYGQTQSTSYPPTYPQAQSYQWPQQSYQYNQVLPPTSSHPAAPGYGVPQTSYAPYPSQNAAADANQQAYSQSPAWSQAPPQMSHPPHSQYNGYSGPATNEQVMMDAHATQLQPTAHQVSVPPASTNPSASASHDNASDNKPELYLAWDDWDFDFDGAIWPKSNEPVDPNLSLGVIIWHPAKQMTRALPATFDEAEEQSLKPTPEKLDNGESVSIYFTAENSHEAFLDVRQTDEWDYIKDDPAFVVFTDEEMRSNLVPFEDCIAQRDRPDEPIEEDAKVGDAEMREADWSVMDHLEQALSATGEAPDRHPTVRESKPTNVQTQEDILVMLGVTGTAKPVSNEAISYRMHTSVEKNTAPQLEGPAVSQHSPAEPQRNQSLSGPRAASHNSVIQRPYGSISSSSTNGRPPPPPPPLEHDRYDPWNPTNHQQQHRTNGLRDGRGSPARSEASNGTAAGSDFGSERPVANMERGATHELKVERSDSSVSRKRSYGDTNADDDPPRQHDDQSKRKRRSQIDAAYSRR